MGVWYSQVKKLDSAVFCMLLFFFCSSQSCYLKKVTRTQDGKTQLKHCKMSNNNIWSPLHKNSSLLFIFEESAVLSGRES